MYAYLYMEARACDVIVVVLTQIISKNIHITTRTRHHMLKLSSFCMSVFFQSLFIMGIILGWGLKYAPQSSKKVL